jgi:AraC-like DNA-binding protein
MTAPFALPPVDPLGEALHSLRMSGAFYCRSELSAPWGVAVPAMAGYLLFHFVAAGRCRLEVPGAEARELRAGDLVLVPHGDGHRILSDAGALAEPLFDIPRESANERYEVIRHGGGGAPVTLICGAVRFGHPTATHMVRLLPRLICIDPGCSPHDDWLQSTLRFMAAEARALQPGGEAVMTRLADIVVIQAIRSWIAHDPAAQTGWLAGLQDRQIGRAIAAIHRDPAQGWTLDALASECAMSRSAFAARFTELVGMPPMQYLSHWRMHIARTWLEEHDEPLASLAERVGYQSEAAFSRAFKRLVGMPPGAVARRRQTLPTPL